MTNEHLETDRATSRSGGAPHYSGKRSTSKETMTNSESHEHDSSSMDDAQIQAAIDRILAADEAQGPQVQHFASDDESIFSGQATALNRFSSGYSTYDGEQDDLAERRALRRVAGLSTELEDVTEVEYRQLRLERVVLAGVWTDGSVTEAENSLRELAALAETAGSEVLDGVVQRRSKPDPSTYLGSGKAMELREIVASTGADTVIVDAELAPSQRRALEDVVKVKVIDRTSLILDIFAQHAKSVKARLRSNWPSWNTCFRVCVAGANPCPARPAAGWAPRAAALVRVARVKPRLKWIAAAFATAWQNCAVRSRR